MDNSSNFIALPPLSPPTPRPPEAHLPRRPVSFTIGGSEGQGAEKKQPVATNPADSQPPSPPAHLAPFPVQTPASNLPLLPRRKRPTFSRHRHDANPALAVKVLQDIQMAVETWHQDLKQTVQQIQTLYMEGPIVDGWLETIDAQSGQPAPLDAALLRHGDPQDLSGYVERLYQSLDSPPQPAAPGTDLGRPGYRLCSLDSDGRVQHFPCPPEQLSTISLAIARHQKLRQLLDHKRFLEAKLKRTVEVMTTSRDTLGIAPTCSSEPELGEE
ncbi:hypothetical protein [Nodosilinea nodulosa]|uniref:hypothetical protein n=1 Tax=Nodosilinea nodulosa TaxID=416001 RepID=UPI00036A61EA|nr:hypothetical protein [Nodosilinea nodulosa]